MTKMEEIVAVQQKASQRRTHDQQAIRFGHKFLEEFLRFAGIGRIQCRPLESKNDAEWEEDFKLEQAKGMNAFGVQVKLPLPMGGEIRTKYLISFLAEKVENGDYTTQYLRTFLGRTFDGLKNEEGFEACVNEIKSQIDANYFTEKPVITIG